MTLTISYRKNYNRLFENGGFRFYISNDRRVIFKTDSREAVKIYMDMNALKLGKHLKDLDSFPVVKVWNVEEF